MHAREDPIVNATLPEELLLVAVDAERRAGCRTDAATLAYGLAGAVVTELLLRGAVRVTERGLLAAAGRPTGDELLEDVLLGIGASRPARSPAGSVRWRAARAASTGGWPGGCWLPACSARSGAASSGCCRSAV